MSVESAAARERISVVAAAVFDFDGRVLIAQRPPGKALAGRWEFPGGKRAEGESERAALDRELNEELGIHVVTAAHVMTLHHDYPDRSVELSMWRVQEFSGEARPLDGQKLEWVELCALADWDLLEADRPFVLELTR